VILSWVVWAGVSSLSGGGLLRVTTASTELGLGGFGWGFITDDVEEVGGGVGSGEVRRRWHRLGCGRAVDRAGRDGEAPVEEELIGWRSSRGGACWAKLSQGRRHGSRVRPTHQVRGGPVGVSERA
jgi:hypothetical protein